MPNETFPIDSSWNLPPTDTQITAIVKLSRALGDRSYLEDSPQTRWEARNLIFDLGNALRRRNLERGKR